VGAGIAALVLSREQAPAQQQDEARDELQSQADSSAEQANEVGA